MSIWERAVAESFDQKKLELIIFPTEECNFRCSYCYEDFSRGMMSLETQDAIAYLVERRGDGLSHLHLNWFGGEPLIAMKVISRISTKILKLAEAHKFIVSGQITTNGFFLNRKTMHELAGYEVRHYQVSLDGWAETHDETRKKRGGQGTFGKIWKNLLDLTQSEENFRVQLRVHFHPGNLGSVGLLISNLNKDVLHDKRFYVNLMPVGDYGGEFDKDFRVFNGTEAQEIMDSFYQTLSSREDAPAIEYSDLEVCYAAKPNSFVVRSDGQIGKCTVGLNDRRNHVGQIHPDGRLELNDAKIQSWMHGFMTKDESALKCPYISLPEIT